MSTYDEADDFDPNNLPPEDENHGGLLAPGEYLASPKSDVVAIGYPNGKARCSFTISLWRGSTMVALHAMYQGIDMSQPKAVDVTESMLQALGAIDPIGDISAAIQRGEDTATLRGLSPENRCGAKVSHETYEGERRLKVALFGEGQGFKDKIPDGARQAVAASLAGRARKNPRGTPVTPTSPFGPRPKPAS